MTQTLSSISLLTQTLVSAWRRDPSEGERRVQRLADLAQTAFAEMRSLLRELTPVAREPSTISKTGRALLGVEQLRRHALPGALTRLLAAMVPETLELKLDFSGYTPQDLRHEQALFRVCQEAVSNAIRHSQARRVWVSASVGANEVQLLVCDDGRGFDESARTGIGMRSMRERMTEHCGTLRVGTRPPRGSRPSVRIRRVRAPAPVESGCRGGAARTTLHPGYRAMP